MRLAISLLFALIIYVLLLVITVEGRQLGEHTVPAIYVFGDSTVDVGNNKYLPTNDPAAFPPYGVDYPGGKPTGRFSNGYTVADYLGKYLGFHESPPPYLSLRTKITWEEGASFASGGSGILNTTGNGNYLTMTKQIEYFAEAREGIINKLGKEEAALLFAKSIFLISDGGNDFFALIASLNFSESNLMKFCNDFIYNYEQHIMKLYELGARKVAIIDVPQLGCIPSARYINLVYLNKNDACINTINTYAERVNTGVRNVLERLHSTELPGMQYSVGSFYDLLRNVTASPDTYGFKEVKMACCGSGTLHVYPGCSETSPYCDDRDQFIFWDGVHPTMKATEVATNNFFNSPQFATPITFKELAEEGNYYGIMSAAAAA